MQVQMPAGWQPSKYDIICGRGIIAQQNEGNQGLRALVQLMLPEYNASECKFQKSKLVSSIVQTVQQASPEGGFVQFVDDSWVRVADRRCREKVGQMFRDALHTKYKSSTRAKSEIRRRTIIRDKDSVANIDSTQANACTSETTNTLLQKLRQSQEVAMPMSLPSSMHFLARSQTSPSPILYTKPPPSRAQTQGQMPADNRCNYFPTLNEQADFEPVPIGEDSMDSLFDLDVMCNLIGLDFN